MIVPENGSVLRVELNPYAAIFVAVERSVGLFAMKPEYHFRSYPEGPFLMLRIDGGKLEFPDLLDEAVELRTQFFYEPIERGSVTRSLFEPLSVFISALLEVGLLVRGFRLKQLAIPFHVCPVAMVLCGDRLLAIVVRVR